MPIRDNRMDQSAPVPSQNHAQLLLGALLFQAILLVFAGGHNLQNLNTDAIAYLRIADYYAHGPTHLMVSGYWGPLLSWLMAPWLLVGMPSLAAARIVMGLSAVVFWYGCVALFRAFRLPTWHQVIGAWLVGLATVFWSVEYISPDLLVAGLMALALAPMLAPGWVERRPCALGTGAIWGLAYLAKAVALPLGLVVTGTMALVWWVSHRVKPSMVVRQTLLTWLACLAVASPWITILSLKYHTLTISTTARIAHAIVGPSDVPRHHPLGRMFHPPEPGRITSWEDPSGMPYPYWSPFASAAYARHQAELVLDNAGTILRLLGSYDWLWLGLAGALAVAAIPRRAPRDAVTDRWRWALLPLGCLAAVYLPAYVKLVDQRYFYLGYPLLLVCGFGASESLTPFLQRWTPSIKARYLAVILAASFAAPSLMALPLALGGIPSPASQTAWELARRFRASHLGGPIAGNAFLAGGRAGLLAAYYLIQPWVGDDAQPTPAKYLGCGANFLVVNRRNPLVTLLDQQPGFTDLDSRLFTSPEESASFPLKAYALDRPGPAR